MYQIGLVSVSFRGQGRKITTSPHTIPIQPHTKACRQAGFCSVHAFPYDGKPLVRRRSKASPPRGGGSARAETERSLQI